MTITKTMSRFGEAIWIVSWGPGMTQTGICRTKAEADEVASTRRPARGSVEPLVGFRSY